MDNYNMLIMIIDHYESHCFNYLFIFLKWIVCFWLYDDHPYFAFTLCMVMVVQWWYINPNIFQPFINSTWCDQYNMVWGRSANYCPQSVIGNTFWGGGKFSPKHPTLRTVGWTTSWYKPCCISFTVPQIKTLNGLNSVITTMNYNKSEVCHVFPEL